MEKSRCERESNGRKVKAASSSKLWDRFKISKLLQVETYLFRTSSNFLCALKTAKVLFQ